MSLGLVLDPVFEDHDTGEGHPERPARLRAVRRGLEGAGVLTRCRLFPPVPATDAEITAVHDPAYLRHVEGAVMRGARLLDSGDTVVCPRSAEIARLAAGSVVSLTRAVAARQVDRGFAAVRPPGHHAERRLAMGFCLFNNVAIAARALRDAGVARVLVVDWDVHHGNGTQHLFEEDPTVFYFSVHQFPLYPGTGAAGERGRGAGVGATLNKPLPPGSGDDAFLAALREMAEAAASFRPETVLVSCGFDAHTRDPLAGLTVTTDAFAEATRIVASVAEAFAGGRLVSVLEGGYDLQALSACAAAHVGVLLGDPP
ncbi:MAG TPA: histone deacetylase [Candidatus Polarisedimenticolaceae bacterium]|nr:histone deacetylase [Candidatus Polarisedimenticolaceae bacterium]